MKFIEDLCKTVTIPKVVKVKQFFAAEEEGPTEEVIRTQIVHIPGYEKIKPGMRIAIATGSRTLDRYQEITRLMVQLVKEKGAEPFIFPAMGSHGGATAEGQREVAYHLNGITEESIGAPILSSMETVRVGEISDGRGVFMDKNAYESDGVIVINRVKPHTNFRGTWESGLMKMMAIGMGKKDGAESYHKTGMDPFPGIIDEVGHKILSTGKILMGVATVDNGYNKVAKIKVIDGPSIPEEEAKLLEYARTTFPNNYWNQCDCMIIKEIGKDISGSGADPNVTGRFISQKYSNEKSIGKIAMLDLTEKTNGNANGTGYADVITRKLADQIDYEQVYPNCIVNTATMTGKIPPIVENDYQAFCLSLKTCGVLHDEDIRMCVIKNSKELDVIYVSETMVEEALAQGCEILSEAVEVPFDAEGNLLLSF